MKMYQTILIFLFICFSACAQNANVVTLSAADFEKGITDTTCILLDVRTPDEYEGGFIKGAKNIDWNNKNFKTLAKNLDKTKPLYIYCLSGGRSGSAANYLADQGFTKVYNLDGGMLEWKYQAKSVVMDKPQKVKGMSVEDYQKLVNKNVPVLVEFYAPWCGPCKVMKPQMEHLAKEQAGKVEVVFIDTDVNNEVADTCNIRSLPTLICYKNGKPVWTLKGLQSKKSVLRKLKL
jgi:thioredoxin 1